jgi:hypothetical protein
VENIPASTAVRPLRFGNRCDGERPYSRVRRFAPSFDEALRARSSVPVGSCSSPGGVFGGVRVVGPGSNAGDFAFLAVEGASGLGLAVGDGGETCKACNCWVMVSVVPVRGGP